MQRRELLKSAALLLGASLSATTVSAMMKVDNPHRGPEVSRLSASQRQHIAVLSQLIIPTTDTPGAIEAGVPEFIDLMVSEWQNESERKSFTEGLEQLNEYSQAQYGCDLFDCLSGQQEATLRAFETKPFFSTLREWVVVGYFTSKVGAMQALRHVHVAGVFIGDYPAKEAGRAWSPIY